LEPPLKSELTSGVKLIAFSRRSHQERLCVLRDDGRLTLESVSKRENLLTGETVADVSRTELPAPINLGAREPRFVLISEQGDNVYLATDDGHCTRYDTRDFEQPRVAETLDLVPEPERSLTALTFMLGGATLVAGDSAGKVSGWFRIKPDDA